MLYIFLCISLVFDSVFLPVSQFHICRLWPPWNISCRKYASLLSVLINNVQYSGTSMFTERKPRMKTLGLFKGGKQVHISSYGFSLFYIKKTLIFRLYNLRQVSGILVLDIISL